MLLNSPFVPVNPFAASDCERATCSQRRRPATEHRQSRPADEAITSQPWGARTDPVSAGLAQMPRIVDARRLPRRRGRLRGLVALLRQDPPSMITDESWEHPNRSISERNGRHRAFLTCT